MNTDDIESEKQNQQRHGNDLLPYVNHRLVTLSALDIFGVFPHGDRPAATWDSVIKES
jgi:hypothetical protein